MLKTEELQLVSEWDKTFLQSEKVDHQKVTFINRYGITLAADLYKPKNASGKYPAIAVSGPFGAVKEQCSGLYAQTMAERGYLTIAFDPSFTGESGGYPRFMASPDINTEDFMAAVDFLSVREDVDPDKIGIIGICGWGGMALNAAALDTRIKATVASTMYDMTRVNANGYFDSEDSEEARYAKKQSLNTLRTEEYRKGEYSRGGGCVPLPVPEDAPFFVKDYSEYYKGRCYHKRSLNSNDGWNIFCYNCSGCNDRTFTNRNPRKNRYICSKPHFFFDVNRLKYHTCSFLGIFHMIDCCQYCIMPNQDSILYINTTLILKFTSCINKNIFTYMNISSAVCIKRRKHSKTFIYFLSGKFRHKLYNFFFCMIFVIQLHRYL